jgi:hypothetical protein
MTFGAMLNINTIEVYFNHVYVLMVYLDDVFIDIFIVHASCYVSLNECD